MSQQMGRSGRCVCAPGDSVVLGAQLLDESRAGQYQMLTDRGRLPDRT